MSAIGDDQADASAWFRTTVADARRIVLIDDIGSTLGQKAELCATAAGYLFALGERDAAESAVRVYGLALAGLADEDGNGAAEAAMAEAWMRAGQAERATGVIEAMALQEDRAMARARVAWLAYQAGDHEAARARLAVAADDAQAAEARWGAPDAAWTWYWQADTLCKAGDLEAVQRLQQRIGDSAGKAETLARLAAEQARRGDDETASVTLALAYQQYDTTRRRWDHDEDYYADPVYAQVELSRAHAALGQTAQALNVADRMDDADYTAAAFGHAALEQWRRGDQDGARATVRDGLERVAEGVDDWWFGWGLSELTRAAVRCDRYDAAVDIREKVTDQPARAWAALGIAIGLYERDHADRPD